MTLAEIEKRKRKEIRIGRRRVVGLRKWNEDAR